MSDVKKIKIGIIGCGTIGRQLALTVDGQFSKRAEIVALCDIDQDRAHSLQKTLSGHPQILSQDQLISASELVIEAACAQAAYAITQNSLDKGKDVIVMSVGGILPHYEKLFAQAKRVGRNVYLPSGALAGMDAIKAAAIKKIDRVTLITRKPPQGLANAPYLKEKNIDVHNLKEETIIFSGSAAEAIKGFPKNVNVCATLSLAGIGPERTKVQIITSPAYTRNTHEIQVEGDFGKLVARTENVPAPDNPKTSFLACLSPVASLVNILNEVKIGT